MKANKICSFGGNYERTIVFELSFARKIWGGDHLKEFGYDLPSDKVGEYWAISAHPHGVSTIANGEFKGQKLDQLYASHRELFGDSKKKFFLTN